MANTPRSQSAFFKSISSRLYVITPLDFGLFLDLGPASSNSTPGVFTLQFSPDTDYNGSIVVHGVMMGPASDSAGIAYMPIPYRQISINNVASDYSLSSATITTPSIIQVPANALSVALLSNGTIGTCTVCSWDINGTGAV